MLAIRDLQNYSDYKDLRLIEIIGIDTKKLIMLKLKTNLWHSSIM